MIDFKREWKQKVPIDRISDCMQIASIGLSLRETKHFHRPHISTHLVVSSSLWSHSFFVCLSDLNTRCFHFSSSLIPFLKKSETQRNLDLHSNDLFFSFFAHDFNIFFPFISLYRTLQLSSSIQFIENMNYSLRKQWLINFYPNKNPNRKKDRKRVKEWARENDEWISE